MLILVHGRKKTVCQHPPAQPRNYVQLVLGTQLCLPAPFKSWGDFCLTSPGQISISRVCEASSTRVLQALVTSRYEYAYLNLNQKLPNDDHSVPCVQVAVRVLL